MVDTAARLCHYFFELFHMGLVVDRAIGCGNAFEWLMLVGVGVKSVVTSCSKNHLQEFGQKIQPPLMGDCGNTFQSHLKSTSISCSSPVCKNLNTSLRRPPAGKSRDKAHHPPPHGLTKA